MPTLEELLGNKDIADNTPITIGDTQIPLGSLRQLNAAQLRSVEDRVKGLDSREADITKRQRDILDLGAKAQAAYEAAEAARRAAAVAPPVNPSPDPWADPWLAPVKSALDSRDKRIEELTNTLKTATTQLQNAATIWAEDRWDGEYSSLDWGKRDAAKRPSRDDLLKFASENKLMDRRGLPSIRAAWEKQSAEERLAEQIAAAKQAGIEEGRRAEMASRVPPPGVPGAAPLPQNNKASKGTLDDLTIENISQDPELRALLEQLPPGLV